MTFPSLNLIQIIWWNFIILFILCLFQTFFCFIITGHISRVCWYENRRSLTFLWPPVGFKYKLMSCLGRAAGDGLSAPTIISKKPSTLLSLHPPCVFLSRHQPGSELIGRAPATQNIKQPAGWKGTTTLPHSLPPTIICQQP